MPIREAPDKQLSAVIRTQIALSRISVAVPSACSASLHLALFGNKAKRSEVIYPDGTRSSAQKWTTQTRRALGTGGSRSHPWHPVGSITLPRRRLRAVVKMGCFPLPQPYVFHPKRVRVALAEFQRTSGQRRSKIFRTSFSGSQISRCLSYLKRV